MTQRLLEREKYQKGWVVVSSMPHVASSLPPCVMDVLVFFVQVGIVRASSAASAHAHASRSERSRRCPIAATAVVCHRCKHNPGSLGMRFCFSTLICRSRSPCSTTTRHVTLTLACLCGSLFPCWRLALHVMLHHPSLQLPPCDVVFGYLCVVKNRSRSRVKSARGTAPATACRTYGLFDRPSYDEHPTPSCGRLRKTR